MTARFCLVPAALAVVCLPGLAAEKDVPREILRKAAHVRPTPQQVAWRQKRQAMRRISFYFRK